MDANMASWKDAKKKIKKYMINFERDRGCVLKYFGEMF